MKKTGLLALLLVLMLLLGSCAQDESRLLERGVVRVGNVIYTYGDLLEMEASTRDYYDQLNMIYMMYGMEPQTVTEEQIRTEAANTLIIQAVVLNKADKMGLSTLTDAEKIEVSARTDAAMAEYRASIAATLELPEDMGEAERNAAIDAAMAEAGITREKVYRAQWESFVIEKTRGWAVSGVKVTEEEFHAAYSERVEADKAEVLQSAGSYGLMVLNGESPLYAPAGYREVDWLYVEYAEADAALLGRIQTALYAAQDEADACEETVRSLLGEDADLDALTSQVTVTLGTVSDPASITVVETVAAFDPPMSNEATAAVMNLARARALENAYQEQLTLATQAANAAIAPEVEEILARLRNGEEWARVKAYYNDDTDMYCGSPVVCADFPYVPAEYVGAAMALTAPGQWTQGVYEDGYGCFVILYVGDVPEGAADPETVRAAITEELLTTKQEESFSSTLDIWIEQASSTMIINYELLGW